MLVVLAVGVVVVDVVLPMSAMVLVVYTAKRHAV